MNWYKGVESVASVEKKEVDAFTQHVMSRIDEDVFKTLNLVQLEAIKEAISANAPFKRHPIDVRFPIPLFFITFYLVLLIGKDRRSSTRSSEQQRVKGLQTMGWLGVVYFSLCAFLPIVLILLYLLKSFLGIDIFEDKHLIDWL